ncbi:hypothetical protein BOTBODRAFT_104166 [Botryobasidium botryosum FD-172 SS1]|uniref:Uncharacterized protein n=1 Tax=Botryobasidium botryosum (strain FD-172 SS1) TaxID=930990 RepID=A0A067N3N4_BOTB1|nr:hypothetical protein BOTBODRAFT_104166 [Botryobasidium botryosum FD-172 SS1]
MSLSPPPSHFQANFGNRRITSSYRHAAPAGPWPFIDNLADQTSEAEANSKLAAHIGICHHNPSPCKECKNWTAYPQKQFKNWTRNPTKKSGIWCAVQGWDLVESTVYTVNVMNSGSFDASVKPFLVTNKNKKTFWDELKADRGSDIRARALFVDKMSGPVLQILGTTYLIEPFFFSSSINWIPSRYQENVIPKEGDHITVTLVFIRSIPQALVDNGRAPEWPMGSRSRTGTRLGSTEEIDLQHGPRLPLRSGGQVLCEDLLALHMVRNRVGGSTLISYHPNNGYTNAEDLRMRLKLVGDSVYWGSIFEHSKDPTFVLLALLWSALYSWDEALENLYAHFCLLEEKVMDTNDMEITRELHTIRAHLLHYASLLEEFRKSVVFVRDTRNPAMDSCEPKEDRARDRARLDKECRNLLSEIDRLKMDRKMQEERVQNVMQLVFTSVNIADSDAMKRLSNLNMFFLPATFVAGIFGMNVKELVIDTRGSLVHYFEIAVPLTLMTLWLGITFQIRYAFINPKASIWRELSRPLEWFLYPLIYFFTSCFSRGRSTSHYS